MSPSQVQQIINDLNHAAGAGWTALVRQQVLSGIEGLIWCGFLLLIGLAATILAGRFLAKGRRLEKAAWAEYRAKKEAFRDKESQRLANHQVELAAAREANPDRPDIWPRYSSSLDSTSKPNDDDWKHWFIAALGVGVVGGLIVALPIFLSVDAISHLINPSGYAIQQLFSGGG